MSTYADILRDSKLFVAGAKRARKKIRAEKEAHEHYAREQAQRSGPIGDAEIEAIITSWHRRLAKTAHPDTGGSDTAMSNLNEERDRLLKRLVMGTKR